MDARTHVVEGRLVVDHLCAPAVVPGRDAAAGVGGVEVGEGGPGGREELWGEVDGYGGWAGGGVIEGKVGVGYGVW